MTTEEVWSQIQNNSDVLMVNNEYIIDENSKGDQFFVNPCTNDKIGS